MALPFPPDDARLAALRAELPALGAGIYLDTATAGPLPAPSAEAMAELAGWELRTGRTTDDYREAMLDRADEARAAVAAVLTADLDQIALTNATTDAVALAGRSVDWRRGGRVVTLAGEEDGVGGSLAAADRADLEVVAVDGEARDEASLIEAFDAAITAETRLVAVPHVAGDREP